MTSSSHCYYIRNSRFLSILLFGLSFSGFFAKTSPKGGKAARIEVMGYDVFKISKLRDLLLNLFCEYCCKQHYRLAIMYFEVCYTNIVASDILIISYIIIIISYLKYIIMCKIIIIIINIIL